MAVEKNNNNNLDLYLAFAWEFNRCLICQISLATGEL